MLWTCHMDNIESTRLSPVSSETEHPRSHPGEIETIVDHAAVVAIVIRGGYSPDGIRFITPADFSLQLGIMTRPAGHKVIPHIHLPVRRETIGTQEVLFMKSGR